MNDSKGFTLIELMVTVVIVGILSSIALPSYRQYILKANRSEAISETQSILTSQERYFLDNATYTSKLSDLGFDSDTYVRDDYEYTAGLCSSPADIVLCVEINAKGINGQVDDGSIMMDTVGRAIRTDINSVEHEL